MLGPIPAELFTTPAPWTKIAYVGAFAAVAAWLAARLSRPVPRTRAPLGSLLVVSAVMGLLAGSVLLGSPSGDRLDLVLGACRGSQFDADTNTDSMADDTQADTLFNLFLQRYHPLWHRLKRSV